ncbi:MAG: xanthine dehydrogenase family protein molybdopterin-binding subunit [Nitrospinota bacterium]
MSLAIVGKSVPRVDGLPKVTGRAQYVADLSLPGMLHAAVLRSPHPHALLKRVDAGEARKVPGVRAVLTGPELLKMKDISHYYGPAFRDQPIVAIERVRHVGEAVVAVAAETREAADRALSVVQVEYEPLPAVHTVLDAIKPDAPLVHEKVESAKTFADLAHLEAGGTNICYNFRLRRGDAEKALAEAAKVFEDEYLSPPASHAHLEPHGVLAQWDLNGKLTVQTSTQSPSLVRNDLSNIYGIPLNQVRVVVPYLGGAYGGKMYDKLEPITTLLAKVSGRPVRWILDREEVFVTSSKHGAVCRMQTGVSKDGRITVRKVAVYYDTGAYAEIGPRIAYKTGFTAAGPYNIPNVWIDSYCVYTHKTPAGPFRGFGVPQVAFAYESHMDKVAYHLGRDPVDLRMEYACDEGDIFASGTKLHSLGHKESLQKCAEAIGWEAGPRKPPSQPPLRGKRRGKGAALALKSVLTPSTSGAVVEMGSDGSVNLLTSTVEMGQGSGTILCQIAAEELGVPFENVNIVQPDTDVTPYDTLTAGSRSAFHMGRAVQLASGDLRRQLFEVAAEALEVREDQLELREEAVQVSGMPDRSVSIAEIFARRFKGAKGTTLVGQGVFQTSSSHADPETGQSDNMAAYWFGGACAAEVEVDCETGSVKLVKFAGGADVGKAIHPAHCNQQILGAAITTLGLTLFESMRFENGQITNQSFLEYILPAFGDLPDEITPHVLETPHRDGPYGAKGVGETGTMATIPAVTAAIFDAVGIWIHEIPITPESVLRALRGMSDGSGNS